MERILPFIALSILLFSGCVQEQGNMPPNKADNMKNPASFRVTSPEYGEGEMIPVKYTCDGGEESPALSFHGVPDGTVTLAVVFDDPDAPGGTYDHWLVWNIPPSGGIEEGSLPYGAVEGRNSAGTIGYAGPCPPSGTHRYIVHAYALDASLLLPEGSGREKLGDALKGHVLAEATLTGVYSRK